MEPIVNQSIQSKKLGGWSWGGFMLDPVLIIGARRHKMLFWYLFMFIPFVNLIFLLVFKIYLGNKGYEIVSTSQAFSSDEERQGFMKGLDHAGFVFFIVVIVGFLIGLCLFVTQIFLFGSSAHTGQFMQQDSMQIYNVPAPSSY